MFKNFSITASPLLHLFYPHNCIGCGSDVIDADNFLCLECIQELPHTHFAMHANNPVEKIFRGRIPVASAMSELFFSKESAVQNLIHELKYRNNKNAGLYLGSLIGKSLLNSNRFHDIEVLVPLPLFKRKEKRRGYNQSEILCRGISEVINKPILKNSVIRKIFTETQTKKHRMERWENVENTFHVTDPASLEGKHVLLVDDVITTGATLESCGAEILKLQNTTLSIATLAIASK